jgi:hypothetical protein
VPGTFGGHPVGADVVADLAFTLGLLGTGGVTHVAGGAVDEVLRVVLGQVDGAGTHTFFSYRVAETLARRGPFAGNPLLAGVDDRTRDEVAAACDTSSWIPLLDEGLPRNYAAVLARAETARAALALVDPAVVAALVAHCALLAANPAGFLDDSTHGSGATTSTPRTCGCSPNRSPRSWDRCGRRVAPRSDWSTRRAPRTASRCRGVDPPGCWRRRSPWSSVPSRSPAPGPRIPAGGCAAPRTPSRDCPGGSTTGW